MIHKYYRINLNSCRLLHLISFLLSILIFLKKVVFLVFEPLLQFIAISTICIIFILLLYYYFVLVKSFSG